MNTQGNLPERYRLYGSIGSPYALKLRALMRYQRVPFDWVPASLDWVPEQLPRAPDSQRASQEIAHVRPPVVPVVYFPGDGSYRNDSSTVAADLNQLCSERSTAPSDP